MRGKQKGSVLTCKVCGFSTTGARTLAVHYRAEPSHRPKGLPPLRALLDDDDDVSYWLRNRGRSIRELDAIHAKEMLRLNPLVKKT
jgi:hypothetical protein